MKAFYPVDQKKYKIIQKFGVDNTGDPVYGKFYELYDNKHPGIDFGLPIGTEVKASFEGIVDRREFHKGMGNVIGIRNGNIVALYAHLSAFKVKAGEIVKAGQLLGLSGDTGAACTEPHLHFELRDISKKPLKNMVFNPPFGKSFKNWQETVVYKVNNTNTKKSLRYLSKAYFGTEKYWKKIRDENGLHVGKETVLDQDLEVTIPNY